MTKALPQLVIILTSLVGLATAPNSLLTQDIFRTGKDYALFFAVDDYASSTNFANLRNPVSDAEAIAKELKEMYAFETHMYKNKDRAAIFQILRQWRAHRFNEDDQLFIFFSGHGDFDDFTAKGYFITHGNRAAQDGAYLDLSTLRNIITQIPCEHILLAIDACYSGTIDEQIAFRASNRFKRPGANSTIDRNRLISSLLRNNTRLVVTSGGKERTPDGKTHSPFANAFLKGLRAAYAYEDGLFTYNDLLGRLERVNPQPYTGTMNSHEEGSFVFISSAFLEEDDYDFPPDNFVLVPGGTFEMGDTFGQGSDDEKPIHTVKLDSFYLSRYEVTFEEYDAFCLDTGKAKPDDQGLGRGQNPVVNTSWYNAIAYSNWLSVQRGLSPYYSIDMNTRDSNNKSVEDDLKWTVSINRGSNGYRLPTEAEWEYAARDCGKEVRFGIGSNTADSTQINYNANEGYITINQEGEKVGFIKTVPVGSLNSPNMLGLHDMSGNVWERCWDWYASDYYLTSPNSNPEGADSGTARACRGGSWANDLEVCNLTIRCKSSPSHTDPFVGFRLARAAH